MSLLSDVLSMSVCCSICNFAIPKSSRIERTACLHQILLKTKGKGYRTFKMLKAAFKELKMGRAQVNSGFPTSKAV
jgi:DNA-directed RNA polymerase subunit RPC12/RpoP